MFHLTAGGSLRAVRQEDGGGIIGFGVSYVLTHAIGNAGAWIVLALLFVVGLLLYFNMTVGDLVAAWLRRREERDELAAAEARQAARAKPRQEPIPGGRAGASQPRHPGPGANRPGWWSR